MRGYLVDRRSMTIPKRIIGSVYTIPSVIQSVHQRYPIWVSGRRNCSAMSRMMLYQMRNTALSIHSFFGWFFCRYLQVKYMVEKSRIHSSDICSSVLGKWGIQSITTGNGQLYGLNPGSSPLMKFPIRPSQSATGMMTARVSAIFQNEYHFQYEKASMASMTPAQPPWKLIHPFQTAMISPGFSR